VRGKSGNLNNRVNLWLCEHIRAKHDGVLPPTHLWDRLSPWCGGGAGKLWIDITSAVWQLAIRCLILGVGCRGQAIQWRYTRDRGTKGRCHRNQFWDCISCKWTLAGDRPNDMMLSYKWWFVFSQPLSLLVALSGIVVAAIRTAPGGRLSRWKLTR